jgi:hypothetical protein
MSSRQAGTAQAEDEFETDPLVTIFPSRSRSVAHEESRGVGEREPLLGDSAAPVRRRKPFYRARPLWLVPFAITASLVVSPRS